MQRLIFQPLFLGVVVHETCVSDKDRSKDIHEPGHDGLLAMALNCVGLRRLTGNTNPDSHNKR